MKYTILIITGFLALFFYEAKAGEIYMHNEKPNTVLYNGIVEANDNIKLFHAKVNDTLLMGSEGGNAWEGLTMGYIIKGRNLKVRNYENQPCNSACAFAALMSNDLKGTYGFHAPYPVGYVPSAEEIAYIMDIFSKYMLDSGKLTTAQVDRIMNTGPGDLIYFKWD